MINSDESKYTARDAYLRVFDAQAGAITPHRTNQEYLVALRGYVQAWLSSIDGVIIASLSTLAKHVIVENGARQIQ